MTDSADLVIIGRVVKAHGIRGEVVVYPLTEVADRFAAGTQVRLGGRPARITASRPHQGRQLVAFDGVGDRTSAERLRGLDIEAAPVDVEEHDTYFAHELVGLPVVADDDRDLGTVSALIELPPAAGYDLLEVTRDDGSTWLLPAADEFAAIEQIDPDGEATDDDPAATTSALQLRVTNPPAGLIDGDAVQVIAPDGDPSA